VYEETTTTPIPQEDNTAPALAAPAQPAVNTAVDVADTGNAVNTVSTSNNNNNANTPGTFTISPEEHAIINAEAEKVLAARNTKNNPAATVTISGDEESVGLLYDTAASAASGVNAFLNSALDLSWSVGNFGREVVTKGWSEAKFRNPTPEERALLPRFYEHEAQHLPGQLVKPVAQFLTGMLAGGMAMKAAGILQGTGAAAAAARIEAQSMFSDFAGFDPHEERLGNLFDNISGLRESFITYTAARPDDTAAEGRFKNMLEGAGIGVVAGRLFHSFKALKEMHHARTEKARKAVLEKYIDETLAREAGAPAEAGAKTGDANLPAQLKSMDENTGNKGSKVGGDAETLEAVEITPTGKRKRKATLQDAEENISTNPRDYAASVQDMTRLARIASNMEDLSEKIGASDILKRQIFESREGANLVHIMSRIQADKTIKAVGVEHQKDVFAKAVQDAKDLGLDFTKVIAQQVRNIEDMQRIVRESMTAKNMYHIMVGEITRLSRQVENGTITPKGYVRLAMLDKNIQNLHVANQDMRTVMGRALSMGNFETNKETAKAMFGHVGSPADFTRKWLDMGTITDDVAAVKWLEANGIKIEELRFKSKQLLALEGNLVQQMHQIVAPKSWGSWTRGALKQFWINNILSGPKTWGVNAAGNMMKMLDMPLSRAIGAIGHRDIEGLRMAKNQCVGMTMFLFDSLRFGAKAFKLNDSILMQGHKQTEMMQDYLSSESLRAMLLKGKPAGTALPDWVELGLTGFGWFGKVINMPNRILTSTDEVFKQLAYRSDAYARLCEEAYKKGITDNLEAAAYAREMLSRKYVAEGGEAIVNDTTQASLATAQEATWTQDLGDWGQGLQRLTNLDNNIGFFAKLCIPFIRTPGNILKDFMQHLPVSYLSHMLGDPDWKKRMLTDHVFRNETHGKIALGAIGSAAFLTAAFNGWVTGSPSPDPKVRRMQEAAGIPSYSIRVGDTWVSYQRADPVGMHIGLAADIMNVLRNHEEWAQLENNPLPRYLAASVINNISSKTYLQGVANFAEIISDPEASIIRYTAKQAVNFMPLSGFSRFTRQMTDPVMRDVETLLDHFRNALPGASSSLPARMNWVTGQPSEYESFPAVNKNQTLRELYRLGDGIMGAPTSVLEGVKLDAEQFSRYKELHGTVRLGGKTMSETLERLFASPGYDRGREHMGDSLYKQTGPREKAVNRIITLYREMAQHKLRKEYPELDLKIRDAKLRNLGSRTGTLTREPDATPQGLLRTLTGGLLP
jgi:hypothetical protein